MKWQDLHAAWFAEATAGTQGFETRLPVWFRRNDAFDGMLRQKFSHLLEDPAARADVWRDWAKDRSGIVSLILLFDQLPRNIYRDSPRSFAFDILARYWAMQLVERAADIDCPFWEQLFIYLPFEHSESVRDQMQSVELFAKWQQRVPEGVQSSAQMVYDFAVSHQQVIQRFGRYPHRNRALGRHSTAAEIEYLADGGGF